MSLPYFEVDVPIRNSAGLRGVHVFTGRADSPSAAVRIAHEVYDQARAAQQAGLEIPYGWPDGWAARGYRPDWKNATAGRWNDPYIWTSADDGDFEL